MKKFNLTAFMILIAFTLEFHIKVPQNEPGPTLIKKIGKKVEGLLVKLGYLKGKEMIAMETDTSKTSIFKQNPQLMKELKSLGRGESISSDLKNSNLINPLSMMFIYAEQVISSKYSSHELDYEVYKMMILTRELTQESWLTILPAFDRNYHVYWYSKELFIKFRDQINQIRSYLVNKSIKPIQYKTFADIWEQLDLLDLICRKKFQEKSLYFCEVTEYYQSGRGTVIDTEMARDSRRFYDTYRDINRIVTEKLTFKVDYSDQNFFFKMIGTLETLKNLLDSTFSTEIYEHANVLTSLILKFLNSGSVENSMLFGKLLLCQKNYHDEIISEIFKIEEKLVNLCQRFEKDSICEVYKIQTMEFEIALENDFVPFQLQYVRLKQEPILTQGHDMQVNFLRTLLNNMEDLNSFFWNKRPSTVQIAIKTLHMKMFGILDHNEQTDEVIYTFMEVYKRSKELLENALLVGNLDSIKNDFGVALLNNVLCSDYIRIITSLLSHKIKSQIKGDQKYHRMDFMSAFETSINNLIFAYNNGVIIKKHLCIEPLGFGDFDMDAFMQELRNISDKKNKQIEQITKEFEDINENENVQNSIDQNIVNSEFHDVDEIKKNEINLLNIDTTTQDSHSMMTDIEEKQNSRIIHNIFIFEIMNCDKCKDCPFINSALSVLKKHIN